MEIKVEGSNNERNKGRNIKERKLPCEVKVSKRWNVDAISGGEGGIAKGTFTSQRCSLQTFIWLSFLPTNKFQEELQNCNRMWMI